MLRRRHALGAFVALAAVVSTALGQITTHTNAAAITIPDFGPATPYPSSIVVAGATTSINNITVRLTGFAHAYPADVQVLLVAPNGQKTMLMSGAGSGIPVSGINLTFAQDSANVLPNSSQLLPGVYRPRNFFGANLPAPAPAGAYIASLSAFNGLNANGTWSLFVNDGGVGDGGTIAGGWSITFNDTLRQPQSVATAFTYQGRLEGVPAGSTAFLRFALWDSVSSINTANLVSSVITRSVVLDANNLFTTLLDFGVDVQRQKALFLEVEAAAAVGGPFATLAPRQALTGVPLALQLRGVTVDADNQVGVGGIEDPQFVFETNGRARVRGDAGVGATSPGIWFSSPDGSGTQVNRGLIGARNDTNIGLFGTNWGLLLNNTNNFINIGDPNGAVPAERLTVTGNIQLNTVTNAGRVNFGPVGNFGSTAENTDAMFFQRSNAVGADISLLRLNLGDNSDASGADAFVITTTSDGTNFTERLRFQSDGNAFKPGGGSWSVLSDATAKDNIEPMTGTLDRLLNLHGYSFTYKPEFVADGRGAPGAQIGLVAQDVQKVFPEWVGTGADGKLFVTEHATTALMVEALRDLRVEKDKQLGALRAENAVIRAEKDKQLAELEARLRRLERSLETATHSPASSTPGR